MPIITSIYAALCALLVLVLATRVVLRRGQARIGLGDGGDRELQQRMRVHANAIENVPLALLLLLLLELGGAGALLLHGFGSAFLLGRVLHGWGFSRSSGTSFGRFAGTVLSWLAIAGMALLLLWRALV